MVLDLQGCFLILESYIQYFRALSRGPELGHIVHRLIEAIGKLSKINK